MLVMEIGDEGLAVDSVQRSGQHRYRRWVTSVWKVAKPENDPVFGKDAKGLVGHWQ